MTPKYNIGDIVLVPMTITEISIKGNMYGHEEARYRMSFCGNRADISEWMIGHEKMEVRKKEGE